MIGSNAIADLVEPGEAQSGSGLSLIFKPGQRPTAGDVLRLAASGGDGAPDHAATGFAVSHQPDPPAGWVELLAGGLSFDLIGLAPAAPAPLPAMAHWYGLREAPRAGLAEAITLVPGEQLRGAENLLPVLRVMTGLAAQLVALNQVAAVVWHPARSVLAPAVFVSAIGSWLRGGAFPALGLTALFQDGDGAVCSEGLAFFIGQELRIEPSIRKNTTYDVKIATRLVNHLVGSGTIDQPFEFIGPNGEEYSVEPWGNDRLLRVCRKT